jgi:hypothetical protein
MLVIHDPLTNHRSLRQKEAMHACMDDDAVAIRTVQLYSGIEGLDNVTLFSGGQPYWGETIYRDDIDHYDTKEFEFHLPDYVEARGKVNIVVFVEFMHANQRKLTPHQLCYEGKKCTKSYPP